MSKRLRMRSDEGFSMILVLGIGLVLTAFAFLAAAGGITSMQDSARHVVFAQNLDVAEAGVDQVTARLQKTNGTYSYCPPTTNVPVCDVPTAVQVSGFASKAAERAWAKATLTQLAADNPSLLVKASGGQFLAIRPAGLQTVYSMSWVPNFAQAQRQRLMKSEYIFSTYQPTNAILTNGNIECCSSYNVGLAANMPAGTALGIHTNGSLTGVPGAASTGPAPVISASASGTCTSPCVSSAPVQTVPEIDPRAVYNSESPKYTANWYDLCPDGKPHQPNTASGAVPCTGAIYPGYTSGAFRGWTRSDVTTNTWTNSGGNYPGIYYVYRGNIDLNNVTLTGAMTMITEATNNRGCAKTNGYQQYKKVDWLSGGFIPGLMVVSGSYWYQNTQTHMGSGAILAQGYVEQQTSSSPGVTGLLIAENLCPGEINRLQGSILFFSGAVDLPISPLVRSTLELELN